MRCEGAVLTKRSAVQRYTLSIMTYLEAGIGETTSRAGGWVVSHGGALFPNLPERSDYEQTHVLQFTDPKRDLGCALPFTVIFGCCATTTVEGVESRVSKDVSSLMHVFSNGLESTLPLVNVSTDSSTWVMSIYIM